MSYFKSYTKSLKMNDWIRLFCKPSKEGLLVSDIDFIFYDFIKKEMMMVEVKTFSRQMPPWQMNLYLMIDKVLKEQTDFKYNGFYVVTLSGEYPEDSDLITINNKQVTSEQLSEFMSFSKSYQEID